MESVRKTVQLQGVGRLPGTPVSDLGKGDVLMWNYGYRTTVLAIEPTGKGSYRITERDHATDDETARVKRGTTLVVRVYKPSA